MKQEDEDSQACSTLKAALKKSLPVVCALLPSASQPPKTYDLTRIADLHPSKTPYLMQLAEHLFGERIERAEEECMGDVLHWLLNNLQDGRQKREAMAQLRVELDSQGHQPDKTIILKVACLLLAKCVLLEGGADVVAALQAQLSDQHQTVCTQLFSWYTSETSVKWDELWSAIERNDQWLPGEDESIGSESLVADDCDGSVDAVLLEETFACTALPELTSVTVTPKMPRRQSLAPAEHSRPASNPYFSMPAPARKLKTRLGSSSSVASRSRLPSDNESVSTYTGSLMQSPPAGSPIVEWRNSPNAVRQRQRESQQQIEQLKRRLSEAQSRAARYEYESEDARAKYETERNELRDRLNRATALSRDNDTLLNKLNKSEQEAANWQAECDRLKHRLQDASDKHQQLEDDLHNRLLVKEQELDEAEVKLNTLRATNQSLKDKLSEVSVLAENCRAAQSSVDKLKAELLSREQRYADDVADYRQQCDQLHSTLGAQVKKQEEALQMKESDLFVLESELAGQRQKNEQLREADSQLRELRLQHAALQQQLADKQANFEQATEQQAGEKKMLSDRVDVLETTEVQLNAKIADLEEQLNERSKKLADVTQQLSATQQTARTSTTRLSVIEVESGSKLRAMQEEAVLHRARIVELQEQVAALTQLSAEQLAEAAAQHQTGLSAVRTELNKAKADLFNAENRLQSTDTQLAQANKTIALKEEQMAEADRRLDEARAELQRAAGQAATDKQHAEEELADLQALCSEVQNELEEERRQSADLKQQHEKLTEQVQAAEASLLVERAESTKVKDQFADLQTKCSAVEQELEEERRLGAELRQQQEQLSERVEAAEASLRRENAECAKAKDQFADLHTKCSAVETQLEEERRRGAELKQQQEQLSERVNAAEASLQQELAESAIVKEQLCRAREQVSEVEAELSSTLGDLEQLREQHAEQEQERADEMERVTEVEAELSHWTQCNERWRRLLQQHCDDELCEAADDNRTESEFLCDTAAGCLEHLNHQLQLARQRSQQVEDELRAELQVNTQRTQDVMAHMQRIQAQVEATSDTEEALERLRVQLEQSTRDYNNLNGQYKKTQADLQLANNAKDDLQAQLRETAQLLEEQQQRALAAADSASTTDQSMRTACEESRPGSATSHLLPDMLLLHPFNQDGEQEPMVLEARSVEADSAPIISLPPAPRLPPVDAYEQNSWLGSRTASSTGLSVGPSMASSKASSPAYDYDGRWRQLDERNQRQPPHMSSTYPVEFQAAPNTAPVDRSARAPLAAFNESSIFETDENAPPTPQSAKPSGLRKRFGKLFKAPGTPKSANRPAKATEPANSGRYDSTNSRKPLIASRNHR